jgi:D-inositol-3-phosphate glycosyltransferase
VKVALLTGGKDVHYVGGLLRELVARDVHVALIGSDEIAGVLDLSHARIEFHNLIGRQDPADGLLSKAWRLLRYYVRLLVFAARTDAKVFHILWCRRFPYLERTLFNVYFKLLGKKVVFTAHNVDDQVRDGRRRTLAGRLSLRILYRVVDHIFVHTDSMRRQLIHEFNVAPRKVTVVPFGINNVIPASRATRAEAKGQLGFDVQERVLLFFGNIAPYKGLEDLIRALKRLVAEDDRFVLLIVGPVKDRSCEGYWLTIERLIDEFRLNKYVRKEIRYIPDPDVGLFFRASDVLVLPYRRVYQSGVVALSYAQGVPAIVADVDSLKEDVIAGDTGLIFKAGDVVDLAEKVGAYFASDLFRGLETRARKLREYGAERFSWPSNAERTCAVYQTQLQSVEDHVN